MANKDKEKRLMGLHKIPDEEYFGKAEVTNSSLRLLAESALHLKNQDLFKLKGNTFVFGKALHCKVLEPDEFDKRFATEDFEGCNLHKNTKDYKEARAKWQETVKDKDILSKDDFDKICKMATNITAIAGSLLKDGDAELAMFTEINGVYVSGKMDYVNHKIKYIFDVKTTQDINKFSYSMVDYNYITQVALYVDMMKIITGKDYKFSFILVESSNPHMVRVATASNEVLEIGRQIYGDLLQKYVNFRDNGILELEKTAQAPEWFLKKYGYGTEI